MEKQSTLWTVKDLRGRFPQIHFPEYQREPNIWQLDSKRRLIDSISRNFDIASIYFYQEDATSPLECIDGRQRLNAIMSFLGENESDSEHNAFAFRSENEVFPEREAEFAELTGLSYGEIKEHSKKKTDIFGRFVDRFLDHQVTIITLQGTRQYDEFSLQFTRLNLGLIINSGEKLHAMVGALRDACFERNGLGAHPLFDKTRAPRRRFSREQTAAQIIAQVLSLRSAGDFMRTRHFDLQMLFKKHHQMSTELRNAIKEVRATFDLLSESLGQKNTLRSRALTVSCAVRVWKMPTTSPSEVSSFVSFVETFMTRVQEQVTARRNYESPNKNYIYLLEFQRHLTQASVEAPAVRARDRILDESYQFWCSNGRLPGDPKTKQRQGK